MLGEEQFVKLQGYDWEKIIFELTLYASDRLGMLCAYKVKLPAAEEPSDYAKQAIELLYEGTRVWNETKYPDLLKFLKFSVVKSLITNERKSPAVKKRVGQEIAIKSSSDDEEKLYLSDMVKAAEPLADLQLIERETLAAIRESLKDDDDALIVLDELVKSSTPAQISKDLGISIEDVRNILKRIRRKLKHFILH
jgi:DNA-directed RNA polymerase specialized sigma24 family protein